MIGEPFAGPDLMALAFQEVSLLLAGTKAKGGRNSLAPSTKAKTSFKEQEGLMSCVLEFVKYSDV